MAGKAQPVDQHLSATIIAEITDHNGLKHMITSEDLKAAITLAPATQDIHTTLNQLIELMILGQEAKRLHFDQHPHVIDLRDRTALKKLITDDFEQKYRLDNLPLKYIEQSTRQNLGRFRHPELRQGAHILIKPVNSERHPMTKDQERKLAPIIDRIQTDLDTDPIHNAEQLQSRVNRYRPWLETGYEAIFESLGRFSRQGPFIQSFTKVCFDIDQAPQLIGPITTPFGFHFTWIEKIIPPMDTPDHEIEAEVRRRILPEVRGYEWRKLISMLFQTLENNGQ